MQTIAFGAIFTGFTLAGLWTGLAIKISTGSWLLSLFAPFFFFSEVLWGDKNFARGFSYHFLALAILAFTWYFKKPTKKRKIVLILALGIGPLFQPVIGLIIFASAILFAFRFKNLKETFSIIVPAGLIASAYYLPLKVLSGAHSKYFSTLYWHVDPLIDTLKILTLKGLPPLILPLALIIFLITVFFARKRLQPNQRQTLRGSLLVSFFFLIYIFGVYLRLPAGFYPQGLAHSMLTLYFPPFLALIAAISFSALTKKLPKILFYLSSILLIILLFSLNFYRFRNHKLQFQLIQPLPEDPAFSLTKLEALFGPPPGETNYRFYGHFPPNFIGDFFNLRYDTPNFGQSSRGLGGQWYQRANTAFGTEGPEKFFYLDWYAIHNIFHISELPDDLVKNETIFTLKVYDKKGAPYGGSLNQAKPILEASNSPSILFIGKEYAYKDLILSLAKIGASTSFFVPVKGPETLEKLSSEELTKFDALFLYHYEYGFKNSDLAKLIQFVKDGGGLVIDTGVGPDMETGKLPEPFPISQTSGADIAESWQIKTNPHFISQEISFDQFSPPLYENQWPWKISTADSQSIKAWAEVVLTSQTKPIVVAGHLGQGKVVWTGFNLLYHLDQFGHSNEQEPLLLKNMLLWTTQKNPTRPQFNAQFVNPDERTIRIETPSRGIIFREKIFPNWKVRLNQEKQKIYHAGPDLMYLPLAKNETYPLEVTFYYQASFIEKAALGIAAATILLLIIAFFKKSFLAGLLSP
jgi:hypothetical protein